MYFLSTYMYVLIDTLFSGEARHPPPHGGKFCFSFIYIPLFVYISYYSENCNCYAGVSMTLALFCTPEYINKRNATLMKLGTNDVNMTTSWRNWFPRYLVF